MTSEVRRRVVLHIGAMKTGTTYLQGKAYGNRESLEAAGVSMPGVRWADVVWGVQDLLGMGKGDADLQHRNEGRWQAVVDLVHAAPTPTSLLTMEFFAFANRRQARRAVESFADCDVEVVVTVRDTAAVVPALWQTTVTSGGTVTWPRFRRAFRWAASGRGAGAAVLSRVRVPTALRFQEAVNIARILRTWSAVLPTERIHVVVVPGPDAPRDRLWELFCEVLQVDPAAAPEPGKNANESLGYPSAELVRRVNELIEIERIRHHTVVKDDLGHHTLGRRRSVERRARLDPPTLAAALRWNAAIRDVVAGSGVRVHGDLADLPLTPLPSHGVEERHEPPTDAELLEAATFALRRMRRLVDRRSRRLFQPERAKNFKRRLRRASVGPANWGSTPDPVATAVSDLVLYADGLIRLRKVRDKRRQRRAARRAAASSN
ncbi:MAG TPA: hypothetical protein VJ872_18315 [Nocardioides sp.]|nr:hypothetical protein [Nocardioides sp.]